MNAAPKPRPKHYDLNLAHLPPPGLVSIIHRVSGAVLFLAIPVFLWLLQGSLGTPETYAQAMAILGSPLAKLVAIGLFWLYAHHFFAGIRYLLLDVHIGIDKAPANASARLVLGLGLVSAALFGWCLW